MRLKVLSYTEVGFAAVETWTLSLEVLSPSGTLELVTRYLVFEFIERADELGILLMIRLRTLRFRLSLEQGKRLQEMK